MAGAGGHGQSLQSSSCTPSFLPSEFNPSESQTERGSVVKTCFNQNFAWQSQTAGTTKWTHYSASVTFSDPTLVMTSAEGGQSVTLWAYAVVGERSAMYYPEIVDLDVYYDAAKQPAPPGGINQCTHYKPGWFCGIGNMPNDANIPNGQVGYWLAPGEGAWLSWSFYGFVYPSTATPAQFSLARLNMANQATVLVKGFPPAQVLTPALFGAPPVTTTTTPPVSLPPLPSTAGGLRWSPPRLFNSTATALVSCANKSSCVVADGDGAVSSYDGRTWSALADIDGDENFGALSCPTRTFCAALDTEGDLLTYNGALWAHAGNSGLMSGVLSCATTTFCLAVSGGAAVTFRDGTWGTPQTIDADPGELGLGSLSCPTAQFCMASDENGNVLTYNGRTWSTRPGALPVGAFGLSCLTARFCVAMEDQQDHDSALMFNGSTWTSQVINELAGLPLAVSCPTRTFCLTVTNEQDPDAGAQAAVFNGTSWAAVAVPLDATDFSDVSCATPTFCVVTGTGTYPVKADMEALVVS
jgi:hypothetical protein